MYNVRLEKVSVWPKYVPSGHTVSPKKSYIARQLPFIWLRPLSILLSRPPPRGDWPPWIPYFAFQNLVIPWSSKMSRRNQNNPDILSSGKISATSWPGRTAKWSVSFVVIEYHSHWGLKILRIIRKNEIIWVLWCKKYWNLFRTFSILMIFRDFSDLFWDVFSQNNKFSFYLLYWY